jgi:hypothetical protein
LSDLNGRYNHYLWIEKSFSDPSTDKIAMLGRKLREFVRKQLNVAMKIKTAEK